VAELLGLDEAYDASNEWIGKDYIFPCLEQCKFEGVLEVVDIQGGSQLCPYQSLCESPCVQQVEEDMVPMQLCQDGKSIMEEP